MESDVDVLLLAAGLGYRLRPLTETTPKPLLEVGGKPLIVWHLERLKEAGLKSVFINLHYLGEQLRSRLGDGQEFGVNITYLEEPALLDTGGTIRVVFDNSECKNLIVINSDSFFGADFSVTDLLKAHIGDKKSPVATLVLKDDSRAEKFGSLGVDAKGRVVSFLGESFGLATFPEREMLYTGVQVLSRDLQPFLKPAGSVFSVTKDVLPGVLRSGSVVSSYEWKGYWNDVGTAERLNEVRAHVGK